MADYTVTWTNEYPGIDYANGTNAGWKGDGTNNIKNVNILRIDLTNSGIGFLMSPFDFLNRAGNLTTDFLNRYFIAGPMQAMYATNANFFYMDERDLFHGMAVSQGSLLSYPSLLTAPCTLFINQQNAAIITTCTTDIDNFSLTQGHSQPWTAVSGNCMLVTGGRSSAPLPTSTLSKVPIAARTAIGLSAPLAETGTPQYLYLITIDGLDDTPLTPPPYPEGYYGATLKDVATWLVNAGAYNAIGVDGGGSTTMAKAIPPKQGNGDAPDVKLMNCPHNDESSIVPQQRAVAVSFGVIVYS